MSADGSTSLPAHLSPASPTSLDNCWRLLAVAALMRLLARVLWDVAAGIAVIRGEQEWEPDRPIYSLDDLREALYGIVHDVWATHCEWNADGPVEEPTADTIVMTALCAHDDILAEIGWIDHDRSISDLEWRAWPCPSCGNRTSSLYMRDNRSAGWRGVVCSECNPDRSGDYVYLLLAVQGRWRRATTAEIVALMEAIVHRKPRCVLVDGALRSGEDLLDEATEWAWRRIGWATAEGRR